MQATSNAAAGLQAKSASAISFHIAMSLTNGGRSLNAIWYLKIPPVQKLILQFLGSELNFNEDFSETIRISRKALAQFICVTIKTLNSAIQSLVESGYIKKINHIDAYECNETSEYGLTEKLFDEYAQFLDARYVQRNISVKGANYKRSMGMIGDSPNGGGGVNSTPGGGVNSTPLYSSSFSPEIENPQSEPKTENPSFHDDEDLIPLMIEQTDKSKKESPSSLGRGGPSPAEQGVTYATSIDFLFVQRVRGKYAYRVANTAAERFIRERGMNAAEDLRKWAEKRWDLHGSVKVRADMFNFLWTEFQRDERHD